MKYNLSALRNLLEAAFSDEELQNFCFDHFHEVYEQFTGGQFKGARIRLLIDYAKSNGFLETLLAEIKKVNQYQYSKYESSFFNQHGSSINEVVDNKVSLYKLPVMGDQLFGREKELRQLDEAWSDAHTRIVCLVAWGGVGKTALVNHWLNQMHERDYRGARRVYGWSFYSQGAIEEKQAAADEFFQETLAWFGDPQPGAGSAVEKGRRLARLASLHKTLLVLDGLETLQYPPGTGQGLAGKLKDPGRAALCPGKHAAPRAMIPRLQNTYALRGN